MTDNPSLKESNVSTQNSENAYIEQVKQDLWICLVSREISLLGRKEVLSGKAKFGILGDGKEVPQVAMARAFKEGDWRSGYYRDQTFMFATGLASHLDFFAQLYADSENDPFSGGRQMNNHYVTRNFDSKTGERTDLVNQKNISADISSTAGQMGRALGLALASKKFRQNPDIKDIEKFSNNGEEVCFCTIGDASTSEGSFWETINAAAVMKVPLLTAVWDDGYGISVPTKYQTVRGSISKAMEGFLQDENGDGIYIYTVKGWDYPSLVATFEKATAKVRKEHVPALIHVQELTQPQGHSTSGSHERYKSKERLAWEREHDCNEMMIQWMLDQEFITEDELAEMRAEAKQYARNCKKEAWERYSIRINQKLNNLSEIYNNLELDKEAAMIADELKGMIDPFYSELIQNARLLKIHFLSTKRSVPPSLEAFLEQGKSLAKQRYHSHLYSSSDKASINTPVINPQYSEDSKEINGFQIINEYFDKKFATNDRILAFGEDVGKIGDVNQGLAGLQTKYGESRIFDTGIREWTIIGQAIGLGIRGFQPIAEIQYLDYLIYALSPLSDDLATLRYRTNDKQRSTTIIRTRGHRLEGIWHAGSPMGLLINSLKGMILAVPRNMVQAAGIYNTLIQSDDPALVIECLNGYRLKEKCPDNIGEYNVPVGLPEVLRPGVDVTLVTYGSCVREAQKGCSLLSKAGISVELIDIQTLIPFDLELVILESIKKTNKIVFMDEDVPDGGTAYMMSKVLEKHGGYEYLDAPPKTITSHNHRTPYGTDGDYFTKPYAEDVFDVIWKMMTDYNPAKYG